MAMLRSRTGFRRFAVVLAAAQLLAYAGAPAFEALTERAPGPVAIEAAHGTSCAPLHAPATCMACQLMHLSARRADPQPLPAAENERRSPADVASCVDHSRPPPASYLLRAPPVLI